MIGLYEAAGVSKITGLIVWGWPAVLSPTLSALVPLEEV